MKTFTTTITLEVSFVAKDSATAQVEFDEWLDHLTARLHKFDEIDSVIFEDLKEDIHA